MDEIFQGKNTVTLGAVAKKWNYCLGLHWSPDRTKESLIAFLKPIAKRGNLKSRRVCKVKYYVPLELGENLTIKANSCHYIIHWKRKKGMFLRFN